MIEALTTYIRENWSEWHQSAPGEIAIALGSGGPAHRTRAACFVFEGNGRRPSLVMKIAFAEQEAEFLGHEHHALATVRPRLDEEMREAIPEVLDLAEIEGNTVMTMRAVLGKRLLVPDLTGAGGRMAGTLMRRFYRDSFKWGRLVGRATAEGDTQTATALAEIVDRFLAVATPAPEAEGQIAAFREAVSSSQVSWKPCWQHCDLAVGNVLVDRRRMRFLDWEHASDRSQPWFDMTQSVGASARLAKRQSGASTSREAAILALGKGRWAGDILRSELAAAWDFDLPLGWGVALTTMATSVRQHDDDRMGAEDWIDFAIALFNDSELRSHLPWAVPER